MKEILKKYNFNYLVVTGAVIFCCTLFSYTIISLFFVQEISDSSRLNSINNNYYLFVISALIIAPIFEEFIFRGYFVNKLLLKIISVFGIIFYIYITDNFYLYILIFALVILHFKKKINPIYIYYINSIIFSLVHYKLYDFNSIFTIIPMFFQFSLGLILIWIVLNFNLIRSILFHFLFNLISIIILTIPLQFPEKEIKKIEHLGYKFEWNKTPIFNSESTIISRPNSYEVVAENVDIIKLYNTFETNSKKIKVINDNNFFIFKFKIIRIDTTASKLDPKTVELLLKKANLIEN
jgi:membrane protease YdiL (CAAX protease family)